jgi:hypothetical protein
MLGETLTSTQIGGAMLVMSGIAVVQHRFSLTLPSSTTME